MNNFDINTIVYNTDGEYGANQCSPHNLASDNREEYKELCKIVSKHFPQMTSEEIDSYIYKLRNESCGYVSMINSLFEHFAKQQDLFREKFGYSYYSSDGSLNYNSLLVDLYCKKDNYMGYRFLFWKWEVYSEYEDKEYKFIDNKFVWMDKPSGNSYEEFKYRFESYCNEHGVKVKITFPKNVNPKNFHKFRRKGYLSLAAQNFEMKDDEGKISKTQNGHYMTITDVTNDQKSFIVSSWGKRYYLTPKDVKGYLDFQLIKYRTKVNSTI